MARTADELGFDSIAIPEHIVMPEEMVELMGSFWSHAMTAMAFVAGATTRIIVDASVIVLPYHAPVVMAKAVSTLDLLSGGRVRLSIGVGHAEREFDVLGAAYHERGRIDRRVPRRHDRALDEHQAPPSTARTSTSNASRSSRSRCSHPHPPIWIGGNSRAAMRRAVRHDGWFPWLITADELPTCLDYLRSQPGFATRTRPFDVAMALTTIAVDEEHRPLDDACGRAAGPQGKQATIDAIGHLRDIGVTSTSVPTGRDARSTEYLERPALGRRGGHAGVPVT